MEKWCHASRMCGAGDLPGLYFWADDRACERASMGDVVFLGAAPGVGCSCSNPLGVRLTPFGWGVAEVILCSRWTFAIIYQGGHFIPAVDALSSVIN